jgi:hypothetical protein
MGEHPDDAVGDGTVDLDRFVGSPPAGDAQPGEVVSDDQSDRADERPEDTDDDDRDEER